MKSQALFIWFMRMDYDNRIRRALGFLIEATDRKSIFREDIWERVANSLLDLDLVISQVSSVAPNPNYTIRSQIDVNVCLAINDLTKKNRQLLLEMNGSISDPPPSAILSPDALLRR